jgi:CBS-domain-containing membrane protein
MTHRTVRDVMTTHVATASPGTGFKELADIMDRWEVSGLPVTDSVGRVVGVVSQTDLLKKQEYLTDPGADDLPGRHPGDRARAAGLTAADVMTSPAITVSPDAGLVEAARQLDRHHAKRLPVVDDSGRLIGLVTPRNLLRIFLRPDEEIRAEIIKDVLAGDLGTSPAMVRVTVAGGVVTLGGEVAGKSMILQAVRLARAVDGVVDVVNKLTFAADDSPRAQPAPARTSAH